jgi:hypothetical protein
MPADFSNRVAMGSDAVAMGAAALMACATHNAEFRKRPGTHHSRTRYEGAGAGFRHAAMK